MAKSSNGATGGQKQERSPQALSGPGRRATELAHSTRVEQTLKNCGEETVEEKAASGEEGG